MSTYHADIADSIAAIESNRSFWDAFESTHGITTPSAHPDRYLATLRGLSNNAKPFLAMLSNNDSPLALIVGRTSVHRVRSSIGYAHVSTPKLNCLDIVYGGILTNGKPDAQAVVADFLHSLFLKKKCHHIMINQVPVDDAMFSCLTTTKPLNRRLNVGTNSVHWVFELEPGSYDTTIKRFSKKHRYNMRRLDRRLCEHFDDEVTLRRFDSEDDIEEFIQGSESIVKQTYQASFGVGVQNSSLTSKILKLEASSKRFRSYWLMAGDKPIAYQLGNVYGNRFMLEATSFLPQYRDFSPGAVLLLRVFKDLCEDSQVSEVDYGFGDAEYKRVYGTRNWNEATLRFYGYGFKSTIASTIDVAAARIARVSAAMTESTGLTKRVKKAWRKRMEQRQSKQSGKSN